MMAQQIMMSLISDDLELSQRHEIPVEERVKIRFNALKRQMISLKEQLAEMKEELKEKEQDLKHVCWMLAKQVAKESVKTPLMFD